MHRASPIAKHYLVKSADKACLIFKSVTSTQFTNTLNTRMPQSHPSPFQTQTPLLLSQTPSIQQPSSGRACGHDPRRCYSGLNVDHFESHFKSSYVSDNRMWLAGDTVPLSFRMYRQYTVSSWVSTPVSKIRFRNGNQCKDVQMTQKNQSLISSLNSSAHL